MAQNEESPRKGGRPPRAGAVAGDVLRVRLTAAERARLDAAAEARGRPVADHVREWIAGEVPPVPPPPPDYVTARERPHVKIKLSSRWTPRYVWTIHMVPGRPDGPPLAVRRRVLRDEAGVVFETPAGDCFACADKLEYQGHDRTSGGMRDAGDIPGQELSLDVYDHSPTSEERDAWIRRRKVEQAYLASKPRMIWTCWPGAKEGSAERVKHFVDLHPTDRRYAYLIATEFPVIDLRDLATHGEARVGLEPQDASAPYRTLYVWPHKPTAEQIAASAAERAFRWMRIRAEQRERVARARQAPPPPPPSPSPFDFDIGSAAGLAALRAFGLDPASATDAEVQAAYRAKVRAAHPDKGGPQNVDMDAIVKQQRAARAYVAARPS